MKEVESTEDKLETAQIKGSCTTFTLWLEAYLESLVQSFSLRYNVDIEAQGKVKRRPISPRLKLFILFLISE